MKSGTSEEQFQNSGDTIHDVVNAEAVSISDKYSSGTKTFKEFDPLNEEAADNKSYARPNIPISAEDLKRPIPEPIQQAPPPKPKEEPKPIPKEPIKPVNPSMAELPSKEKELAAKKAAQMTVMGYKVIHKAANWSVSIGEKRLKKLDKKGVIDLKIPIPLSPTQAVPMIAYVAEYNKEVSNTFTVSKEFEEEVTPILERIYQKRGIGATDEEMLMGIVAIDLLAKGTQWVQLMGYRKSMIEQLKEVTEAYRQGQPTIQNVPPPPAQQNTNQQQQSQPQPAYSQPPTPPSFEDEVEVAEIIPNDVDEQLIDVIPEPTYGNRQTEDITDFQEEVREKRKYNKRDSGGESAPKKAAHRPKGTRKKLD